MNFLILVRGILFLAIALYGEAKEISPLPFSEVYRNSAPAIVWIKQILKPTLPEDLSLEFSNHELYQKYLEQAPMQLECCSGTGFFISSDGLIMTNYHLVKNADLIDVGLIDGRNYGAQLIGFDLKTDLALLKIDEKGLPFLTFGNSESVETGEWVAAIGNPYGLETTLTVGVVSARRNHSIAGISAKDLIQTDAVINPGNSGGPLLNSYGEVVGINTAVVSQSAGYIGIGFAIPSNIAFHAMSKILKHEPFNRANDLLNILGIEIEDYRSEGVIITNIDPDSPSEAAGLKPFYLITGLATSWDRQARISNKSDFMQMLASAKEERITFIIKHQNQQKKYIVSMLR